MSAKRAFDIVVAAIGLLVTSPILLLVAGAIFLGDFHHPLYISTRIGRNGQPFRMVKFRSMVVGADRTGVTSTSANDSRITRVGQLVRRFKLDELVQLWNVLKGDMSLVGPRPNVPSGVALYTPFEQRLLTMRSGITDFASIVFADEAEILKGSADPDASYNALIRPWKSRLGVFYIERQSIVLDIKLIWWTLLTVVSRRAALNRISDELARLNAPPVLVRIARRDSPLEPAPPPESEHIPALSA